MNRGKKVVGIVGSYRKGGTIDTVVSEVLAEARNQGADISKVHFSECNAGVYCAVGIRCD